MYEKFLYQTAGSTGTRTGISAMQRQNLMDFLEGAQPRKVRHGDCIGFDREMHYLCRGLAVPVGIHPPSNPKYRAFCPPGLLDEIREPKPYLERDWDIVTESDYLVACPKEEKRPESTIGSGTWTTVSYAERLRMETIIFYPDGRIEVDGGLFVL